jgi:hypothetical protein
VLRAIAYVDVNADGDLMQFAETVAVNRMLPVAVFSNVADAEKWLLDKDHALTEPPVACDGMAATADPVQQRLRL